jgi:hypothetical protein
MTRTRKPPKLVRYVSPFGSPAHMTREEAERYRAQDDKLWLDLQEIGALSDRQREIGAPHIQEGPR